MIRSVSVCHQETEQAILGQDSSVGATRTADFTAQGVLLSAHISTSRYASWHAHCYQLAGPPVPTSLPGSPVFDVTSRKARYLA